MKMSTHLYSIALFFFHHASILFISASSISITKANFFHFQNNFMHVVNSTQSLITLPNMKKNPNISNNIISSSTPKKLHRLPHVFAKVLELPFHFCADVTIQETPESFRFSVAVPGSHQPKHDDVNIRANAIEICPGVTKIVIHFSPAVNYVRGNCSDYEKWRYRLPAMTRPELATATYAGRELVVIVPKKHVQHVNCERGTQGQQARDIVIK